MVAESKDRESGTGASRSTPVRMNRLFEQ